MKQCPRCKELIGDTLEVCPMCKTEFTPKQLEEMKRARETAEFQAFLREKARLNDFKKKRKIMSILLLADLGFLFLSPLMFLGIEGSVGMYIGFSMIGVFVTVMIGAIVFGVASGGAFCPYCGRTLFRNYGDHCASCGKKLF